MVLLLAIASTFTYLASCPLDEASGSVCVEVSPGDSTVTVAQKLKTAGVIRSPLLFRILARLMKADSRIQVGEYQFEPGIFAWDAIESLVTGKVIYYTLTVREGLSVEEIASLIEERGFGSKNTFLETAKDASLLPSFITIDRLSETIYPLEGYLFPDTYYIRKGMSEREMIQMMVSRLEQVFTKDLRDKAASMNLTPHQAATIASIVEKEAAVDEERPIIAAVYLNRLKINMKLDADPTVLYALGKTQGLLLRDLDVESPYNTYRNQGLMPGPIANFGKASLEAVFNPANVNYLYFVSKNDGTHAFAETFAEHNRNINKYQH
jgi:UPF0755 protein